MLLAIGQVLLASTRFRHADSSNKPYNICLMTRLRSEHNYFDCMILEWLEYHLQLGVDHFFITDDCSPAEHSLQPRMQPYIDLGVVTTFTANDSIRSCDVGQVHEAEIYVMMFEQHVKPSCKWVANMDVDEVRERAE
jgi:hypothetical protein